MIVISADRFTSLVLRGLKSKTFRIQRNHNAEHRKRQDERHQGSACFEEVAFENRGSSFEIFKIKHILQVYQKGGLLRSDKLLGVCEWKLDKLEHDAEMEESLPLKVKIEM